MANENPECRRCELAGYAKRHSVCLKGRGGDAPKLLVFLDNPNVVEDKRGKGVVSDGADWLFWAFTRMGVKWEDIYVDYVLKCYPGKNPNIGKKAPREQMYEACSEYRIATLQLFQPLAVVAMGKKACEAFIGQEKVSEYEGSQWTPWEPAVREVCMNVWVTYSPAYALQDPAESVGIFRTLWAAAEAAGLEPKITEVRPFDYGT